MGVRFLVPKLRDAVTFGEGLRWFAFFDFTGLGLVRFCCCALFGFVKLG